MAYSFSNRQTVINGELNMTDGLDTKSPVQSRVVRPRLVTTVSRTGNDLPNYPTLVKKKIRLPENVFYYNERKVLYPFGAEKYYSGGKLFASYFGALGASQEDPLLEQTSAFYPADFVVKAQKAAQNNLLKNLKDSKINMGTALAEAPKSFKMIAETAEKIASALRSVRKGNIAQASRDLGLVASRRAQRRFNRTAKNDQAKAVASAWLELQYGWKPLLSDVYNAARLMADTVSPIYLNHCGSKVTREYRNVSSNVVRYYEFNGTNMDFAIAKVEVRYRCTYSMENTVARRAALNGLTNPLMVAWELVPYSFVVDWFLPVGNYLELLDAKNGLSYRSGGVTTAVRTNYSRTRVIDRPTRQRTTSQALQTFQLDRGVPQDFPESSFPSFQSPASLSHALNALALLTNLRK